MSQYRKFFVPAMIAAFVLLGLIMVLVQNVGARPGPSVVPTANILYLVPNELPAAEGLGISNQTLQTQGMQILHTFKDLQQTAIRQKPDAILVHQQALTSVDRKWFAEQYRAGIIVGGINIKVSELVNLVNDPTLISDGPPLTEDWYKKPYYSFVGKYAGASGGGQGFATNNINPKEGTFEQFMTTLKRDVQNYKSFR